MTKKTLQLKKNSTNTFIHIQLLQFHTLFLYETFYWTLLYVLTKTRIIFPSRNLSFLIFPRLIFTETSLFATSRKIEESVQIEWNDKNNPNIPIAFESNWELENAKLETNRRLKKITTGCVHVYLVDLLISIFNSHRTQTCTRSSIIITLIIRTQLSSRGELSPGTRGRSQRGYPAPVSISR